MKFDYDLKSRLQIPNLSWELFIAIFDHLDFFPLYYFLGIANRRNAQNKRAKKRKNSMQTCKEREAVAHPMQCVHELQEQTKTGENAETKK